MHRWPLLWLGLVSPALAAQAKRAIQPNDIAQLRELTEFRISPDGRRAVFIVREPEDTATPGERNTDLWLAQYTDDENEISWPAVSWWWISARPPSQITAATPM